MQLKLVQSSRMRATWWKDYSDLFCALIFLKNGTKGKATILHNY
jgi:hypothetical protein